MLASIDLRSQHGRLVSARFSASVRKGVQGSCNRAATQAAGRAYRIVPHLSHLSLTGCTGFVGFSGFQTILREAPACGGRPEHADSLSSPHKSASFPRASREMSGANSNPPLRPPATENAANLAGLIQHLSQWKAQRSTTWLMPRLTYGERAIKLRISHPYRHCTHILIL